jgi:hypothetical protein
MGVPVGGVVDVHMDEAWSSGGVGERQARFFL